LFGTGKNGYNAKLKAYPTSVVAHAMIRPTPKDKIIETKTTITKVPEKQKQLIDSIQNIVKKYKDK
jgi:hypothetical protein